MQVNILISLLEPAVQSVYDGEKDYIISTFRREKSKFLNETVEFNIRSSYILTVCRLENNEMKITQKRYYNKCPLPIKSFNQTPIYVESRCSGDQQHVIDHHQNVQSGEYISFGLYNNRTIYRKSRPGNNGNYWFLSKINDVPDSWNLHYQSDPDKVFNQTFACGFEHNQGEITSDLTNFVLNFT